MRHEDAGPDCQEPEWLEPAKFQEWCLYFKAKKMSRTRRLKLDREA